MSFLSGQYGLAGDNIVEYETVLANGSIVNFNQERHPEIVRAMRGAGSQFGMFVSLTFLVPLTDDIRGCDQVHSQDLSDWKSKCSNPLPLIPVSD